MSNLKDDIDSSSNDDLYQQRQNQQHHRQEQQQQYRRKDEIDDDDIEYYSTNVRNRQSNAGKGAVASTTAGIRQLSLNDNRKQIIMATATDAIKAKYATVHSGYYSDPYVSLFYYPTTPSIRSLSQVIIKRGTLGRVKCIERAIRVYISQVQQYYHSKQQQQQQQQEQSTKNSVQIVVIGAGYDTTYLRFFGSNQQQQSWNNLDVKWYEIDHNEIITEKVRILRQQKIKATSKSTKSSSSNTATSSSLFNIIESISSKSSVELQQQQSSVYRLTINEESDKKLSNTDGATARSGISSSSSSCYYVGYDLNNDPEILLKILQDECCIDSTIPTLLVMECVQMYLTVGTNTSMLTAFQHLFSHTCTSCLYEPILGPANSPSNTFGKMMEQNFIKAGFVQKQQSNVNNDDQDSGSNDTTSMVLQHRTIQEYLQYYKSIGFSIAGIGCDMYKAYTTILPKSIQQHANQCEFLDELEEFILIMQHYCFIVATNDPSIGALYCSISNDTITTTATDNYDTIGFRNGSCEIMK